MRFPFIYVVGWCFQDVPLDLDIGESTMQHIAAILSRNRDVRPRERGSTGPGPSGSPAFRSRLNFPQLRRSYEATEEETHGILIQSSTGDFAGSDVPVPFMHPPSPVPPVVAQSPQAMQGPCFPENSSFSESLRSKFSSASARFFIYYPAFMFYSVKLKVCKN